MGLRHLISLLAALFALGVGATARAETGHAIHFTRAEVSASTPGDFNPPPTNADAAVLAGPWRSVSLPDVTPRPDAASAGQTAIVTWYRLRFASAPATQATYFYLPRWQTIGRIAVYADGRLIYAPRSGPVWNSFNTPVWIKLAEPGAPVPGSVLIRISRLPTSGAMISTAWIGDEGVVAPHYRLRRWLQLTVPAATVLAAMLIGSVSLCVWIWGRREPFYLLLFLVAAAGALRDLQFYIGDDPPFLGEAWFGWLTLNALEWRSVAIYFFALRIIGARFLWLGRGMVAISILLTLVTVPVTALARDLAGAQFYLVNLLMFTVAIVGTIAMWVAYFRKRSYEGLWICLVNLLNFPLGIHDWLFEIYRLNPEDMYWLPYLSIILFSSLIYIVVRRYLIAAHDVEQANIRLESRLRERETELEATHRRLREVEHQEMLTQERARLMRDMHDGMGSSLMGALAVVEQGRVGEADIAQMLRECLDDLKLTIDSLEPVEDDLLVLLATLRFRLEPRLRQAGIHLAWQVGDVPPLTWLDPESALQILRIVQEIFTNIVKHAKASEVTLATSILAEGVLVTVQDNGVGFAVDQTRAGGRGLTNLAHRARSIHAAIVWTSSPGATRFDLTLPLHGAAG